MGGPTGHRINISIDDWMRSTEKQVSHQERRPQIRHASDLMGPGVGPQAVEIASWEGDETRFNGYYFSRPGARGAPNDTDWWIGHNIAAADGYGMQVLYNYRSVSAIVEAKRRFGISAGFRVFSAWLIA